jgi:hypothetical protein
MVYFLVRRFKPSAWHEGIQPLFHKHAKKCWLLINPAGVWIVPGAHGNWDRAGLGNGYFSLGGSRSDTSGGGSTSKGENDDEGADKILHERAPGELEILNIRFENL